MTHSGTLVAITFAASLLASTSMSNAADAITSPAQKTIGGEQDENAAAIVPELAVLNSAGATLANGKLTMTGTSDNAVVFTDRPYRAAGHGLTANLIKEWGDGSDSFKNDPPNATISVLDKDGKAITDAVIVLKQPVLDGNTLTFDVDVLQGDLGNANGPASLFIDWFSGGRGGGDRGQGGHFANPGFHQPGSDFHAGWYRHRDHHNVFGYAAAGILGATAGAIAAGIPANNAYPPYTGYSPYSLYPYSTCGYYPEPPCY